MPSAPASDDLGRSEGAATRMRAGRARVPQVRGSILDDAELSARVIADQRGRARPSTTQDVYLGRKIVDRRTAQALKTVGRVAKTVG